jgi:ribosomal protein L7/L12
MNLFGWGQNNSDTNDNHSPLEAITILNAKADRILNALHLSLRENDTELLPPTVASLLARGLKIQAIKEYRELTGVGLKEAKDAVEGVGDISPLLTLERKLDLILENLGVSSPDEADPEPDIRSVSDSHLEELVRRGDMIEAIRAYRERHNTGLREAKEAVDALRLRLGSRVK